MKKKKKSKIVFMQAHTRESGRYSFYFVYLDSDFNVMQMEQAIPNLS